MAVRTILADHADLALKGMRAILEPIQRIHVLDEARTARELLRMVDRYKPDVVLIDHISSGFGTDALRRCARLSPHTRIVAITPDPSALAVTNAIRCGVRSYIKKDCGADEIIDAVLQTADGDNFFCGQILETIQRDSLDVERIADDRFSCDPVTLTERETEIICLIVDGLSYTQIADRLHLSAHTVTTHRRNIMQKIGVNNTAALVMYAVKAGLSSPNKFLFHVGK